jgi:hypothetical protein
MTSIAQNFLTIQETLNQKLSLEWKEKGWNYPDAMFTEATEAFNHLNWEWWRAVDRKIDWDQVKLEWVDVGHFLFSEIMASRNENKFKTVLTRFQEEAKPAESVSVDSVKSNIKEFIHAVLSYDSIKDEDWVITHEELRNVLGWFLVVVAELGLTIEQYYTLFIGKVCLNQLRWKNGYKKGIYNPYEDPKEDHCSEYYIKNWDGVEDNEWLSATAATLDPASDTFKQELESLLDQKYAQVYAKAWDWVK